MNDTGGSLLNGLVTVAVHLRSCGDSAAAGSAHLDITNPAAPGQVLEYRVAVPMPQGVDPPAVDAEVLAQGRLP